MFTIRRLPVGFFALLLLLAGCSRQPGDTPATPKGRGDAPDFVLRKPPPDYTKTLTDARAASHDYFWDLVRERPEGATYENVKDFLAPIRYVNAPWRYAGVILSPKGSSQKMRFIENGFQLDANLTRRHPVSADAWTHGDTRLWITVGPKDELFGLDEHKQGQPVYEEGYLPAVHVDYTEGGVTYRQEIFADHLLADYRSPLLDEPGVAAYMRITATDGDGVAGFDLSAPDVGYGFPIVPAGYQNSQWTDEHNNPYVFFSPGGEFNQEKKILRFRLAKGESVYAVMPHQVQPAGTKLFPSPEKHAQAKERMMASWRSELAKGGSVSVPEKVVMDAWRSLFVGNWQLTIGDELPYGMFSWYQGNGYAETLQYIAPFIEYGYFDDARRFIQPILEYPLSDTGVGLHVCANRLELAAYYYAMTRDAEFIRRNKNRLIEVAVYFLARRNPEHGMVMDGYGFDLPDHRVVNINTNSNGWRAIRNLGLTLTEVGEKEEGQRFLAEAEALGNAVRKAVADGTDTSTTPHFVPFGLGEEKPYGSLVESKVASYYNLVMPYFFESEIFHPNAKPFTDTLEFMWNRQGVMAGLNRFDQHSTMAFQDGIHPLYTWGRQFNQISRRDTERAVYTFYSSLAHGYTRGTFLTGENQSTVPSETEWYRGTYLPPEPPANALLLRSLRHMLIHEHDLNQDGEYDQVWLLSNTPAAWLEDGKEIALRDMPSRFGRISLSVRSELSKGRVTGEAGLPAVAAGKEVIVFVRLPAGYRAAEARLANGSQLKTETREGDFAVYLPARSGKQTFTVSVSQTGEER